MYVTANCKGMYTPAHEAILITMYNYATNKDPTDKTDATTHRTFCRAVEFKAYLYGTCDAGSRYSQV